MIAWLFDLGNSRLKFASRQAAGGAGPVGSIDHRIDAGFATLPDDVRGEVAWVAAVASPALQVALLAALAPRFPRISFARTLPRCGGVRIAYAEPARLGVDRFLTLLAAHAAGGPVLACGVGTALTLDLLDGDGVHRGGRIAPSPTLMRESLHARAAQLPVQGGRYAEFADDTVDALASGCEGAALALVERSRVQAADMLGVMPRLWLHGGGANALLSQLPKAELKSALVLDGLARWAALGDGDGRASKGNG